MNVRKKRNGKKEMELENRQINGGGGLNEAYNLRFPHPSTHLIVGPSGSGKTRRTAQILRLKDIILKGGGSVQNVVFCYALWQDEYDRLKDEGVVTRWVNKLPTEEEFINLTRPYIHHGGSIVVIDDFMTEINKDLVNIVTKTSGHSNTTTFILFQSLFPSERLGRQISLNVKFMHIHKNPRENAQIQYLARQLSPTSYKWIVQAYHHATRKPYSSFLIDLTQKTRGHLRFRSNYLPTEFPMRIWFEKGHSVIAGSGLEEPNED